MIRFFLLFIGIQTSLFFIEMLLPVQKAIIIPFTESLATISGYLIQLFDQQIIVNGIILRSLDNGFAVSIQSGCNGVEAVIILISGILAFPASIRYKAIGVIAGTCAIQAINLLRIISLYYLGQWNTTAFEWAHLYLWQVLVMLDALIVFLIWIYKIPKPTLVVEQNG